MHECGFSKRRHRHDIGCCSAGHNSYLLDVDLLSTHSPHHWRLLRIGQSGRIHHTQLYARAVQPPGKGCAVFQATPFVLMKKKHRVWLHLNPWLAVGQPGLRDMNGYWRALTDTLRAGLATPRHTLILSSHLLSPRRTARLLRHFPAEHYRCHTLSRPVGRAERTGLQIDTFLKEWRWYAPSMHCGVLMIRKKDKRQ